MRTRGIVPAFFTVVALASPVARAQGPDTASVPATDSVGTLAGSPDPAFRAALDRRVRRTRGGLIASFGALQLSFSLATMSAFVATPWCFSDWETGDSYCGSSSNDRAVVGFAAGASIAGLVGVVTMPLYATRLRRAKVERRLLVRSGIATRDGPLGARGLTLVLAF